MQHPLGGWHTLSPRVDLAGSIKSASEGLENSFGLVMVARSTQNPGVKIESPVHGHGLEKVAHQVYVEDPEHDPLPVYVNYRVRTPAQIYRHKPEGFIHRHVAVGSPHDPRAVSQGSIQRLPQANRHVLGQVVSVHVQIATGGNVEVKKPMVQEQRQEVIQKAYPGADVTAPHSIQSQSEVNLGLRGHSVNCG